MQKSQSYNKHNAVDYYILPNGMVDVFMHKNEISEEDEEGNTRYIADEVYFQVDSSITKEYVENNFNMYWESEGKSKIVKMTDEERLKALENAILNMMMGVV